MSEDIYCPHCMRLASHTGGDHYTCGHCGSEFRKILQEWDDEREEWIQVEEPTLREILEAEG